jgi:hypothetical protein
MLSSAQNDTSMHGFPSHSNRRDNAKNPKSCAPLWKLNKLPPREEFFRNNVFVRESVFFGFFYDLAVKVA